MKTIITTNIKPKLVSLSLVREIAKQFDLTYINRLQQSKSDFLACNGILHCLILKSDGVYLVNKDAEYKWHPNTALLKLKDDQNQGKLIGAAAIKEGDLVLDLTMGLGSDTLILADAVGVNGRVTAVESEKLVFALTKFGIEHSEFKEVKALKGRMDLINEDYTIYLNQLSDNSYDVVYIDPMFKQTKTDSYGIDALRGIANYLELSKESIANAMRVAKRCVVIKTRFGSNLQSLLVNAKIVGNKRVGKTVYLVIDAEH